MTWESVLLEKKDRLATITLNHPEKINDPAVSYGVSIGKIRSKDEASFGELNPHWGIKRFQRRNAPGDRRGRG
jgi:hypothetical protein